MLDRPLLSVPDAALEDLRARLRAARLPRAWPGVAPWAAGTEPAELRRLVTYWAEGFDWRAREAELNALPSHFADIDGTPVHYLRFDAERADALPLVLTHGWPSSVLELVPLARRLAEPTRHGGEPRDAFTVIVPSLPGYAFSPPRPAPGGPQQTHEVWHRLMREHLGFARYGAHGGDLGAGITARLAEAYPEEVTGIHVLAVPAPAEPRDLDAEERAYLDEVARWQRSEGGYQHEQSTRPLTLSPALADSPAGLLAWLVEKYRAWTDGGGGPGAGLSDDYVLTQASLYWFTDTISTSFLPYWEYDQGLTRRVTRAPVPAGVAVFPADLTRPPRRWAERTLDVARYTVMPRGGHFAAWEEPELLAEDLRAFFRERRGTAAS
ncbi:epoxide hydrolase family protein [Streptomyces sp. SID11385]|uniref:alpha/beta fold hydrolase n=1 Tax=Streptomyces sp. SID11385 TaxID=2706031 RepID=UPI0013C81631|nr:epoxide hydrolase [Streptomyces sp. SID11385]